MNLPANWLDYGIDALVLISIGVLTGMKIIPPDMWEKIVLGVVVARAALRRPPGDGGGGSPVLVGTPVSGAATALVGAVASMFTPNRVVPTLTIKPVVPQS